VLNDLLDLTDDRLHPRKFERPLAAGNLPLGLGVLSTVGLVGMGLALAALQSRALLLVLVAYLALSLGYSIYLKRLVLVDVVVLAALYTVRIIAGTVAIEVPLSSWLLAFSMFIFLSLALIKRSSELITVERMSRNATAGRDYRVEDRAVLTAMGVASGYIAIVVLALYIDSPEGRGAYGWPGLLWLACPTVLYWISRLWIKTARGEMHDDPLFFSLRDRASWIAFAAIVLVTLAAI
jgi:4-hydroxybenzoate polyprenyltransferase